MNKVRGSNLNEKIIEDIVEVIDEWSSQKLTWDLLIEAINQAGLPLYTRQALERRPRIKLAYLARKEALRAKPGQKNEAQPNTDADNAEIEKLKAKVKRLELENNHLHEVFKRWLYNATNAGVSTDVLDRPMPDIDRNPTVNDTNVAKKRITARRKNGVS
jgi:predicted nuclease with TOPRIM domain